jgi:hypothetical protein
MRNLVAGAIGGLIAGAALSGVMLAGRRAGLLHRTLAEHSEDWLDRNFASRAHVGKTGTFLAEQGNHFAASAVFGAAFGAAYPFLERRPIAAGALYGTALYAVNIACIAPVLGITNGETAEPPSVPLQRLGLHVLFGVVTAIATAALLEDKR